MLVHKRSSNVHVEFFFRRRYDAGTETTEMR